MKRTQIALLLIGSIVFSQELIDGIAAIIGNQIILKSDVEQFARMSAIQLQIDPSRDRNAYSQLVQSSLNALIDENIMLEQARIETIEVKDRDVEATLDQRINEIIEQVGSRERAEEILGGSISKVKRDYRESIRNRMIVEKLKNEKFNTVSISRREVDTFFQTYKDSIPEIPPSLSFSHILFSVKPGVQEQESTRLKADSILKLIRLGNNFEELARRFSDDPGSAALGGDLGYLSRGDFIKSFEEAAFSLKRDEISDIVLTEFGYHIIQLIDRQGEKINVRHILLTPGVSDDNIETTRKTAQRVLDDILNEKITFDSAAVLFSDDKDVKINRGTINRISTNQIKNQEFIGVLDTLSIGYVSSVFQTNLGFHILRLNSVFDDTWPMLEQWALEYKRNHLYQQWIKKLRTQFFIDIK